MRDTHTLLVMRNGCTRPIFRLGWSTSVDVHGTPLNKEFRRKFRVTKSMFDEILVDTRASGQFPDHIIGNDGGPPTAKRGRKATINLGLKILACLRVLALGIPIDGVSDTARMGESTIRLFFKKWVIWFEQSYYARWVTMPQTEEDARAMERLFAATGLPGCLTSMDGVHIRYNMAPAGDRLLYVGKEGFPTLMFNVHVTHNKRIVYISEAQFGARNDKTVVHNDEFVQRLRTDDMFTNMTYVVYDKDGNEINMKGAYCLCDGGYHKWLQTMCGYKLGDKVEAFFGKRCESIRKDVECVFGILKKRFRVLDVPMMWHSASFCASVFRSCAILHNWLLDIDGHASIGHDASDWMEVDLNSTYEELFSQKPSLQLPPLGTSTMFQGSDAIEQGPTVEIDIGFHARRLALATHMTKLWERREALWLRPAREIRP